MATYSTSSPTPTMSPLRHTTKTLSAISTAARTSPHHPPVRFASLSIPPPFTTNPKPYPSIQRPSVPYNRPRSIVRCCGSITDKPLFDFQRKRKDSASLPDDKLCALRDLFSKPGIGIDAYVVPSQDAHQSEFIAECFMRRAYISGFTGSAGTAVVTRDKAALWTDGRYFLQVRGNKTLDISVDSVKT
ncbi:hypothetical protein Scep_009466 [Stephania cephalantha]|uniref:Creatinase N-terminal domain-containing protein n=1 Tax=Stephania cephalantha TaxID=152367 RepID=A0AAP0JVK2_9MAGN